VPPGSEPPTLMAGQVPTPVSATVRAVPPEVVITSDALLGPGVAGWNETASEVLAPPSSEVTPGAPAAKSAAFAPVMANGGVSVMPVASVFVIVTGDEAFEPGGTVPKSTLVGDIVRPPEPVPLKRMVTLPALVLVTTSDAVFAPLSTGWNETGIVAVPPAATVVVDTAPLAQAKTDSAAEDSTAADTAGAAPAKVYLQISSSQNPTWADQLAEKLRAAQLPASVLPPKTHDEPYRVVLGPYATREQAEEISRGLGMPSFVITIQDE